VGWLADKKCLVNVNIDGTEASDWISEQRNVNCEWIQLAQ